MAASMACVTCRVAFATCQLHRQHYQSDWHRYNLKRNVAELPPITLQQFEEKAALQQDAAPSVDAATHRCEPCAKTFASLAALDNHKQSKKHRERVVSSGEGEQQTPDDKPPTKLQATDDAGEDDGDSDWSDESTNDENADSAIPNTECLFCGRICNDVSTNLQHMCAKHGFYIPDIEYCTDAAGLLTMLGYKVGVGHECVQCARPKNYRTIDAIRKHMHDKGHCALRRDDEAMLEMSDFFDYSSSYPDAEMASPTDEVDTATDDSATDTGLDHGWQLQLPSGATIGHRALRRYYRQKLRPPPMTLVAASSNSAAGVEQRRTLVQKLMNEYRHLQISQVTKEIARRRAIDQKFMRRQWMRAQQRLGIHNNKLFVFRGREE